VHVSLRKSRAYKKKRRPVFQTPLQEMFRANRLEREIHAGADHTKIVIRAVHEIPAEITDPADMRS
jgi:hypothetical protein